MRKWFILLSIIAIGLIAGIPASAQSNQPVVYALLLYSPTCPHCHDVIQNHLPGIQSEFGDRFVLLFADVTSLGGNAIAQAVYQTFNIPDEQHVVPMLIIGSDVLIGSVEIPERLPGLIREGLAVGGIPLPDVPGLREAYESAIAQEQTAATPAPAGVTESTGEALATPTLAERLAADPVANALAVGVLLGLVLSVGVVLLAGARGLFSQDDGLLNRFKGMYVWLVMVVTSFVGFGITLTLVAQQGSDPLATPLAWSVAIMLLAATIVLTSAGVPIGSWDKRITVPGWLLPVVAVAGLVVAFYLAYVEVNETSAVCGAVGNCNAVQQSDYARLFGVLPIGVLGVIGYAAILVFWFTSRLNDRKLASPSRIVLTAMVLFGALFSIYLTFLEPFVIGATCAWCLTSAVIMLLLLWLVAADWLRDAVSAVNGVEK